jgi:hypothetical protein
MTINERVERQLIGATQVVQPETILRWQRAGFKALWWWKSRCAPHGCCPHACPKPLLLREAVKEAVASGRVEKLQPKDPQTWKTTTRVGKSFDNGWRFRRTSDRRQIRPLPSPKGPSSRTSFSAAAASRTTESWDGCCRASAGRDRSSRPIRLERFSPLARSVDFERYDFRVGGLSGRTVEIASVQIGLASALEIIDPQVAAAVSTAGERLLSSPITGIACCCARAASGHAAAAPPSSVMNSRLLSRLL